MTQRRPRLYRSVPAPGGASREQSREHRGSGLVRSWTPVAPVLRDQGPDRPAGTARPITASGKRPPVPEADQSRCYLGSWRAPQFTATVMLSVVSAEDRSRLL